MFNEYLPLTILIIAFLSGLLMLVIKENNETLRTTVNLCSAAINIVLIMIMVIGVYQGEVFETRLPLLPDINLVLKADALSLMFVTLSGVLWFFTTIYAVGYFKKGKHRSRFFGFFGLCVFSTLGVALAGNLITFLIFYELLTLATYPLIVHKGNAASLQSGKVYLRYTMIGGAILMVGVVWLKSLAGALDFSMPGTLVNVPGLNETSLSIIFIMLMTGLGVKAALFPLHGWLPRAMAAPAPVSSLLHAVAVVKAGAFGIVRVVYDVYGIDLLSALNLLPVLLALACFTILYGSFRAISQDDIKKRLAYSTVSQVSYITLGVAMAGPIAAVGAIAHLVHQGLMKITMFFCAGNLAESQHVYKVSELDGIAKKMPITMTAFTIAIFGMIGIPPIAGFVSKWYLGVGAIEAGYYWVIGVLAGSSLLNAIYFLPIVYRAWFNEPAPNHHLGHEVADTQQGLAQSKKRGELYWMMLLPPVVTISLSIAAGLFANSQYSALTWAKLISSSPQIGFDNVVAISIASTFSSLAVSTPSSWLLATILLPFIVGGLVYFNLKNRLLRYAMPLVSLPAVYLGLYGELSYQTTSFLFFGSELALNDLSQPFLLLSGILWFIGSLYALFYPSLGDNKSQFYALFCVAMGSSYGLVLSADLYGFISFFTVMSLCSYVLIIRGGAESARVAANTYIKWLVIGEIALFSAFCVLSAINNGSTSVNESLIQFTGIMLVVGFGIKLGLFGFHSWLPLAHPVAAVPASALLSGFMVKAGMIGWLKFFPFEQASLVSFYNLGLAIVALGMFGMFYAALRGIFIHNPKAVLAYSTVSQMGILSTCFGVILMFPEVKESMTLVIILYSIHHGLTKSALFLSVGIANQLVAKNQASKLRRILVFIVIIMPAISLVGGPFTTGFFAKAELKYLLETLPYLKQAIVISSIFTGLLMCRFIHMLYVKAHGKDGHHYVDAKADNVLLAICMLSTAVMLIVPFIPELNAKYIIRSSISFATLLSALMPLFIAVGFYAVAMYMSYKILFLSVVRSPFDIVDKGVMALKGMGENICRSILNVNLMLNGESSSTSSQKWYFLAPKESTLLNMQSVYASLIITAVFLLLLAIFMIN